MNYCDPLFDIPERLSGKTALVDFDSGDRYTFAELKKAAHNLGNQIREMGYRPGDVLTTHLYNSAEAVIAHLAIQYAGCISCLLDPLVTPDGLGYYLKDTRAKCLFTHLPEPVIAGKVPPDIRIIAASLIKSLSADEGVAREIAEPHQFFENDAAVIFYTSGTTSQPKGVLLSPKNFFTHLRIFVQSCYQYQPGDNLLCFVPFSHGYGSKSVFLPAVKTGAAIVIMRSFHPLRVLDAIERENITHIFGVPSHYQQLLRREEFIPALRKLKAAFSAAALLRLETARIWKEKTGLFLDEGYGLIETATGVVFRRSELPARLGDIGRYPGELVEIGIMDENETLLPAGERGEIVVRGDCVMLGYLNKPQETERVIHQGWFHTGDMGYKTEDDRIVLTGRLKDVINIAGIKVAPFEIEAVLNEHPAVNESAVVGVQDETYGEVVIAFVKLQNNSLTDERELIKYLQIHLMNFQVPRQISFVENFPRTNMGKIDKKALRSTERIKDNRVSGH